MFTLTPACPLSERVTSEFRGTPGSRALARDLSLAKWPQMPASGSPGQVIASDILG